MSDIYSGFAEVYDLFMNDVDYDLWTDYIEKIWDRYGLKPGLVLELACGTGNIAIRLSKKGYELIGVDFSEDMLAKAKEKALSENTDILFLQQDMREVELYGTVDACICLLDGLNYILEENEIQKIFMLVHNYLNPGGLFIFDINTAYKFSRILDNNTFCRTEENAAYTWENYYDQQQRMNEYYINVFIEDPLTHMYKRFEEVHYEKAYEIEWIKNSLKAAGFETLGIFDELSFDSYKQNSERVFFTARKPIGNN